MNVARMRDMRRLLTRFFTLFLIISASAIIVRAGRDNSSRWTVQHRGIDTNLRGVSIGRFVDSSHAVRPVVWASGSSGVILRSKDLGKTWNRLHVQGGETLDFRSIQAFNARKAYVMSIGNAGNSRIYKTTDGGKSWKLQYSDARKEFFLDALVCDSEIECFAVGDPIDGKFVILRTVDGETWNQLPTDQMPAALPEEGAFAASGTCLAVVDHRDIYFVTGGPAARLFHSSDAGFSWTVNDTPIVSGNASSGNFSIAVQDKALVVVGGDYKDVGNANRVAAYSADQGKTWKLAEQQPGGFRSAVDRANEKYVAAVGPNGEDVSDDGGAHWRHTDSLDLNALAGSRTGYVWAVGPHGTIARSTWPRSYTLH
jgi:photosystem II stability/assembly factor-like uncharacterized protein